jgi:hypothetical protein
MGKGRKKEREQVFLRKERKDLKAMEGRGQKS